MGRQDYETETLIAHSLRAEGFDASEDGTGRGTPLVPVTVGTLTSNGDAHSGFKDEKGLVPVAFNITPSNSNKDYNARETERAQALTAGGNRPSARGGDLVAFAQNTRDEVREMAVVGALAAEPGMKQQTYIAFTAKDHGTDASDISPTLRSGSHDGSHANGGVMPAVAFGFDGFQSAQPKATMQFVEEGTGPLVKARPHCVGGTSAVRRLTPEECEKLQGFSPGYTAVPYRGKPAADGPRYKALGNSMAVPCMLWLGQRIQMVEALQAESIAA